jgi:hypothetical protein
MSERISRLRMRGGTADEWTAANPVLLAREFGIETNTRRMKMGDGSTAWASLPYFLAASDVRGQVGRQADFTIAAAAAGTYRATGATGTLDAETALGLSIGVVDPMGLRNTGSATVLLRATARASIIGGNNHTLGVRLAVNGTGIAQSDSRMTTASNTHEAEISTTWIVSVPAGGELSIQVANHDHAGTMTLKRAALIATQVQP